MSGDDTVDGSTSGPLRVCARHLLPMDAQVFAACLQNEGIAAVVMDADTISVTGAVFSALPRGGVQVMAPASHFEEADRIRAAFDSGEFAIDEDFDVGAE
jgi:hypothetical protein